jgi:hypothetical protein
LFGLIGAGASPAITAGVLARVLVEPVGVPVSLRWCWRC